MIERLSRLSLVFACALFLMAVTQREETGVTTEWLRAAYAGPVESWPAPTLDAGAEFTEFGPLPARAEPDALEAERIALGAKLFEERHLSASGQIACVTCHNRELGWGDGLKTSFGHDRQRGQRNAQSLFTAAFMAELFWDGRSPSLEDQAHGPIKNPIEMAADVERIEAWLNADPAYRALFQSAYGVNRIAMAEVTRALASFERSIRPPRSKWDRVFAEGTGILNDQELWGLHLFRTKARCAHCHNGPLLTDQKYHNLGISFYGRIFEDVGRYAVTGNPADVGRFSTPSLRAVRRTGPYMHNGLFPDLLGVVNLYNGGGGKDRTEQSATTTAPPPQKEPLVQKLGLTPAEREALAAFLETL